jgi:hypothetical protein
MCGAKRGDTASRFLFYVTVVMQNLDELLSLPTLVAVGIIAFRISRDCASVSPITSQLASRQRRNTHGVDIIAAERKNHSEGESRGHAGGNHPRTGKAPGDSSREAQPD